MKIIYVFLLVTINIFVARGEGQVSIIGTDNSVYYVNNEAGAYATVRFDSQLFEHTSDPEIFKLWGHYVQFISISYDDKRYFIKGQPQTESDLLLDFMDGEMEYLRKSKKYKLKPSYEEFLNCNKKLMLLWSYRLQNNSKQYQEEIKLLHQTGKFKGAVDSVSYQMNLTFVANKKLITIVYPVYLDDDMDLQIARLKSLADEITVFGFPINIQAMAEKEHALENHQRFSMFQEDSLVSIQIPEWLNVCMYPGENGMLATMPEFQNIMSVLNVQWERKKGTNNFKYFIDEHLSDSTITRYEKMENKSTKKTVFYDVLKNDYFKCIYVFKEGQHANCWISFISTPVTYELDLPKINEFVLGVSVE